MRWPIKKSVWALTSAGSVASIAILVASASHQQPRAVKSWFGYASDAQHTGISTAPSVGLGKVKWTTPIDMFPQSAGSAHYASMSITAANTVVIGVKTGESDGFQVEGHRGSDGSLLWKQATDYSVALTNSSSWTSIFPIAVAGNSVFAAGAGGTFSVRTNADDANSVVKRYCFYTPIANYDKNPTPYANIKLCTPFNANPYGFSFVGYRVFSGAGSAVVSKLAHGGIVKLMAAGPEGYKKANDLVPSDPNDDVHPCYNAAPVLSNNGTSVYEAFVNATTGTQWLVKFDIHTMAVQASVKLLDPFNGFNPWVCSCNSASPTVGPDGHVFMGILRNNDQTSHGWMLQFDQNLKQTDSTGKRFPIGAFGWDDTAAIVPAKAVKAYNGKATYLILTKYNNYASLANGDGRNKLAVLDPTKDNVTTDRVTGMQTMNEVLTVLGITCDTDFYACTPTTNVLDPKVPVREWCINTAAIDPKNRCAIVNSEDGHAYKWDFDTNTLKQGTMLEPATGEPYTPSAIGPDGTSYVINNANLHAIVFAPIP